jgi:hypothetical protein
MAWYYYIVFRCDRRWVFSFFKGPQWQNDRDSRRYVEDLVFYSGQTDTQFTARTWRHRGRPGDQWEDLGFYPAQCP